NRSVFGAAARRSFSVAFSISSTTVETSPRFAAPFRSSPRLNRRLPPDVLDGEHMLARPPLAAVLREPRAAAALTADEVLDLAAANVGDVALEADRPFFDELLRAEQSRVHLLEHRSVVRQLRVEERALRQVVPDLARGAERPECDALRMRTDIDLGLPVELGGEQLDDVLVGGGEIVQHAALAREAAERLWAHGEHHSSAVENELPRARLRRARPFLRERAVDAKRPR